MFMKRSVHRVFTERQQNVPSAHQNVNMDEVWSRIDRELERRKKTWAWLYATLGYDRQRVNNWRRRGVPPKEYQFVADALGCSVDWVARGVEEDATPNRTDAIDRIADFTVRTSSDIKTRRAPVVEWARLGVDLYREPAEMAAGPSRPFITEKAVSQRCFFVSQNSTDLEPTICQGDMLLVDVANKTPKRDQIALFRMINGDYTFMRYRPTVDGFEAYNSKGGVLDSKKHGLTVEGTCVLMQREQL